MTIAERRYQEAQSRFAAVGVDVDAALARLARTPLSLPCWQGDDAVGFEGREGPLTGGVQVTGGYPGQARSPQQLRQDLEVALGQIPGSNMEALLQPLDQLRTLEREGRRGERLALLEGMKYMPYCDVWDQFCLEQGALPGTDWLAPVLRYERETLLRRT